MNIRLNLIMLVCLLSLNIGCSQKQKQENLSDEEQVAGTLKEFYTAYINVFEYHFKANTPKPGLLPTKIDSIQDIYLTTHLHKYLDGVNAKGLVLDFDPFLGGQMVDIRMLDEMTFKKKDGDLYLVKYKYGSAYQTIKLEVVKEGQRYKISDAFFTGADEREYKLTKDEWHK